MKKYLLILLFLIFGFVLANSVSAQQMWHHHNGVWHNHPHTTYHYHNNVGYYPVVQWYPVNGVNMNIGPVYANPYNRRVYMNIGPTFYYYRGYSTFNFATGEIR